MVNSSHDKLQYGNMIKLGIKIIACHTSSGELSITILLVYIMSGAKRSLVSRGMQRKFLVLQQVINTLIHVTYFRSAYDQVKGVTEVEGRRGKEGVI